MSEKVQFVLSGDAMDIINASATERKRGEWLSNLVTSYASLINATSGHDEGGMLERIDAKLTRIEKQLAILLQSKS